MKSVLYALRKFQWLFIFGIILLVVFVYIYWPEPLETYPIGWEKSFYVSPPFIEAKNPQIARRGNIIAIVYQGKETEKREVKHYIYTSLSLNGGKNYLPPIRVASVSGTIDHNPAAAISSNGHIVVVWQNIVTPKSTSRLFYSLSHDLGASWSEPNEVGIIRDDANDTEMDMLPLVEYDDKNQLHLFYHGVRGDAFNLFYAISQDGKTFSLPRKLVDISEGLRGAFFPAVRLHGSNIYIVWQGRKFSVKQFTDDLYFLKSSNYGASFSKSKPITYGIGSSVSPSLEVKDNTLYVVYQNNKEKTWGIWLSVSKNGGESWETPIKVSDTNANCYAPSVAYTSSDELHVIWYDLREGYPALFTRKISLDTQVMPLSVMISRPNIPAIAPTVVNVEKKIIVAWREGGRILTNYSDVYVAPPIVTSPTHPENQWSRAPSALIEIIPPEDEAGIKFYSIVVNQDPNYNPPDVETISGKITRYQTPLLDDGIHYVHVRAVDNAGNISKTVHYRLQISRSPVQISSLQSPTHREGIPENAKDVEFRWDVATFELVRIKGFLIGFSKDVVIEPKQFTTDFSAKFTVQEEGRYFFTIRAVDKTNTPGTIFSYEIIVGQAAELDVEKIKKIAKEIQEREQKQTEIVKIKRMPKTIGPIIDVHFPFDIKKPFTENSFDVYLSPRNISEKYIEGYSIVIDTKKPVLSETINLKTNTFKIKNLQNGTYYLGYKAKYFTIRGGKKRSYWSEPQVTKFSIAVTIPQSPLVVYSDGIVNKILQRWITITILFVALIIALVGINFGDKILFYIQAIIHKIYGHL